MLKFSDSDNSVTTTIWIVFIAFLYIVLIKEAKINVLKSAKNIDSQDETILIVLLSTIIMSFSWLPSSVILCGFVLLKGRVTKLVSLVHIVIFPISVLFYPLLLHVEEKD